MKTIVLNEAGYEQAMLGISLSWASNPERSKEIAPRLAHKQGGHNKFLESIMLWLDVMAPRYWWQEADTYRTGSTKQSESTMHTIMKRNLTQDDFEHPIHKETLVNLNNLIYLYREGEYDGETKKRLFHQMKSALPEGFLQRRIWVINYKTLQNIWYQRRNHRLDEWRFFFADVMNHIEHPELIIETKPFTLDKTGVDGV